MVRIKMEQWGNDIIFKIIEFNDPGGIKFTSCGISLNIASNTDPIMNTLLTSNTLYITNGPDKYLTKVLHFGTRKESDIWYRKLIKLFNEYNIYKKSSLLSNDQYTVSINNQYNISLLFKKLNDYTVIMQVLDIPNVLHKNYTFKSLLNDLEFIFTINRVNHELHPSYISIAYDTKSREFKKNVVSIVFDTKEETSDYYNKGVSMLLEMNNKEVLMNKVYPSDGMFILV